MYKQCQKIPGDVNICQVGWDFSEYISTHQEMSADVMRCQNMIFKKKCQEM